MVGRCQHILQRETERKWLLESGSVRTACLPCCANRFRLTSQHQAAPTARLHLAWMPSATLTVTSHLRLLTPAVRLSQPHPRHLRYAAVPVSGHTDAGARHAAKLRPFLLRPRQAFLVPLCTKCSRCKAVKFRSVLSLVHNFRPVFVLPSDSDHPDDGTARAVALRPAADRRATLRPCDSSRDGTVDEAIWSLGHADYSVSNGSLVSSSASDSVGNVTRPWPSLWACLCFTSQCDSPVAFLTGLPLLYLTM